METNIEEMKIKCLQSVEELFQNYNNSEYMLNRISNHINNYLPKILNNEYSNHIKRINRNAYLSNEQQIFIQVFLNKYQYFYLHNNNFFYEYNGNKYYIVKEDDIIHNLLSSISKDRTLLQWKYKTKINIVKLIKERNLFHSIPESNTIQNVLNILFPSIFQSKNIAKYFLTIIGDNILKKNSHLIFLVSGKMKQFLNELDAIAVASIGNNNTTHNFMTKYHENHEYENCRLIQINETYSNELWREILKKIGLDLLCVATHYSIRNEQSDKFIDNKTDEEHKSYTYYLRYNTQKDIINSFCEKYIILKQSCVMEWKHIHFIWKHFLSKIHLPNVIYSNSLKNFLKERFDYNEELDVFTGITSIYIPIQNDFIKFWNNTICCFNNNNNIGNQFKEELEVDELCSLFKHWAKTNINTENLMTNGNIGEENVINIIKHFFPEIEIIEDKYVLNVGCVLWVKKTDIDKAFIYIKEEITKQKITDLLSFDDLYKYYNKYCNLNSIKMVVSKRYFEKYLAFAYANFIIYERFITPLSISNFVVFN